jgi:hypothetical protein
MSDSNSEKKIVYINNGTRENDPEEAPLNNSSNIEQMESNADSTNALMEDALTDYDTNNHLEESDENAPQDDEGREDVLEDEKPQSFEYDDFEGGSSSVKKPKGSYASSESSNESMTTAELLSVDPLYFRLNLFLKSDEGENVANLLKKVCNQLETLNENFDKLLKTSPKE